MNQRFLTNFSLVVIKYCQGDASFSMGNASFLRSEIFLSASQNESSFQNYLFYAETEPTPSNYDFKVTIEFQQEVLFRHRLSNKYLAYSVEYQDDHNDSIVKLTLSDKPCYFKIAPCFQYQTKISPKVKLNQDIYLATELNSTKLAYVAVEKGDTDSHLRTLLSLSGKSKLILHAYSQLEKQETGYVYGQAVWVKHVESNAFGTVLRPQGQQEIAFQTVDMQDTFQSINGLWLIQSIKTENGGNLNYSEPFYFKSLATQKYLSFGKDFKMLQGEKVYSTTLLERPNEQSRFMFESLKGEESKIRKGAYLILRHCTTGAYLGCRHANKPDAFHYPLLTFSQFQDEDLFDLIQLKTSEEEAMRFIFSIKQELQHIDRALSTKNVLGRKQVAEIGCLYRNIFDEMNKLTQSVMFQQVQQEMGSSIVVFCKHLQQIRGRVEAGQGKFDELIKSIYQTLRMICRNCKQNQINAYYFIQNFVQDVFKDAGAQELLSEIFLNNYSLLCKVPNPLMQLRGCNLINAIFSKVAAHSDKSGDYWTRIIKIFDLLQVVLHHREETIDINQRLIATELFQDDRFSRIFFQVRVFNQRVRILHPELRKWVQIQQLRDNRFLRILQRIFKLLAELCRNRNFISKQYVDRYLNATNKEGIRTVISYLNIPISPSLGNYLFSLITNCYIDSSPRIDRHKPLAVLAFSLEDKDKKLSENSSQLPEGGLRECLLDRSDRGEKYLGRTWSISNMLEDMASNQPKLNQIEFELYKEELDVRLREGDWSQQLLRAMCILIKLQSFNNAEIQEMFGMLCSHLLQGKLPNGIITSIMEIFQQITTHSLELQLKKVTAFLKYRFSSQTGRDFQAKDVKQYLCNTLIESIFPRIRPDTLPAHENLTESKLSRKYRKQYNQIVSMLKGLTPAQKIKDQLLQLFIKSTQDTPFSVLSSVFKTMLDFYSPKLRMVRLLTRCIILTHEEVDSFEETYKLYKKMKHLTSIAEHWLANSGLDSKDSQDYCHLMLQFTNFLYEGYTLNADHNRKFRKNSKLSINRQLLVLNLNIHQVVLDLLKSNFYLLQLKDRSEVAAKVRQVFQVSFQFLFDFCRNCQQGLQAVVRRLQIIERFRDLAEVGQTKLLILIYRQWPNLAKQVKPLLIEKIIAKILRVAVSPTSPAVRLSPLSVNERDCEYNPEYLEFLNTICFNQGKIYKKNLQIIFRVIDKESVLKRLQYTGKEGIILDPSSFRSSPMQVPILYHKQLIKLLGILLKNLEYSTTSIKINVKESINFQSLFRILALPDIYSHRGTAAQLFFVLKKDTMVLLNIFLDKTDSLLRIYESEALSALLEHYTAIFLIGKQRQAFPCDSQVQFIPFLEQYAAEIKYDLSNQRDYFTSQVQPLLSRLLQLFQRYSKRDTSRNYSLLIRLVEGVTVANLPQDHLLRHQTHGIDQVQLKWRNFINASQQNSSQQKFVKKTILELLRHESAYELLKQQRQHFFKKVRDREQQYLAMMSRLIAQASAQDGQAEQSQSSRQFFYELIRSLAQYLVWSTAQGERRGWQGRELSETLIGYLTREEFQFNNAISRKTFYQILRILVFLLEHDSEGALLRDFHKIFSKGSSFRFFNSLREAVGEVADRIVGDLAHQQINDALRQLQVCGEQRKCEIDREALKFLALLCRYPPFTDLLRSQPFNASTDFLDKIYNSFYFMVKRTHTAALTLNVAVVSIAEELLDCVQSMLNGCNQANQNYVIDNKFPQIVVEALKLDAIHQHRNLAQLSRRDRLTEQVCGFYLANGINVADLIAEKLYLMDFQHSYLLNRFKYSLLKLALQTVLANQRGLGKLRILLPIQLLKINLIWIYEDHKHEGMEYTEETVLRPLQPWPQVVKRKNLSNNFLMIGFFFFQLIQQHNNQLQRDGGDDEADTTNSEEKEKQKIIRKFFSSISEKEKKEENIRLLQKQPFAEQMKIFYNKYYEAYAFFSQRTATIEANVFGNLVQLYFPVIPLCHKITQRMEQRLIKQAERISHQQKIKSLMAFQKENYDFLQGEEDYFIQMDKKSQLLGRFAKLVRNEDNIYLFVWAVSVVIVLAYLLDDFASPKHSFKQSFATYLVPSTFIGLFILLCSLVNLGCGCLLLVNIIIRKVPFLMRLHQDKYAQELKEEGQMSQSLAVYQAKHIFSAAFFDLYCIIFSIFTIFHPLFAGFLLVYIVKRIQLGKTIVRAIEQTWFSLFVAAALLIVFNYIFSILIYCASFTDDIGYGTTCKTLFTCLLMLVDQSLKAGSGFLSTNSTDYTYMTLNFKVIAEIMYILFAQKVIFQIFSGTIIDKFGELREEGDSTQEDEESNCYICGQQRFQIDFQLQGFEQHVRKTHNKLSYIHYLFYIRRKARTEYGIDDHFIWEAHEKADNDWIPDGISLQKLIKDRQKAEQADQEKEMEQYEKYYQKKLQQFKKLHVKVENLSSLLKEDNLFL